MDDEKKIRDLIKLFLQNEGFAVKNSSSGQQALDHLNSNQYDLVILDLMMPGIDGWEVCRQIRKNSEIPIIMLTARNDEVDRVIGLELGADDYIVKPFSPREMVARVKAVLRRTTKAEKLSSNISSKLTFNNISIDPDSREISCCEKKIILTPKEFDLLLYLARSPGRAYSREQLLENVWGYDYFGDLRTVDTHINRLRDKLHQDNDHKYIATVWGVGYKFEVDE